MVQRKVSFSISFPHCKNNSPEILYPLLDFLKSNHTDWGSLDLDLDDGDDEAADTV